MSQLGIECSNIAQTLIQEQYFINRKKEEKEIQSTSQFATNLGEDYDVNNYIQKYTDFMLFNQTDHAFIPVKKILTLRSNTNLGQNSYPKKGVK